MQSLVFEKAQAEEFLKVRVSSGTTQCSFIALGDESFALNLYVTLCVL